MISIVIGYKNRDLTRVIKNLDSLANQSLKDFELIFIDYGSDELIAQETKVLVSKYDFAKYYYSDTKGWFWNRAHALNTGIKKANGDIILLYDIDLIVEKDFIKKISALNYENNFYTFSCFYLPQHFDLQNKVLEKDGIHYEQNYVGLCAVNKSVVFNIEGFDEYFMVWGGEDDDLYQRLVNKGLQRNQVQTAEYKVFHQWHPIHSPVKPTLWYLTMVNYLFNKKKDKNELPDWGIQLQLQDRPILKFINEPDNYKNFTKLGFWEDQQLLFFNLFIEQFHRLTPGEKACLEYDFEKDKNDITILKKIVRLVGKEKTKKEKIDKKEIINFLEYFIGINRIYISDYFLMTKYNKLLFVLIKK